MKCFQRSLCFLATFFSKTFNPAAAVSYSARWCRRCGAAPLAPRGCSRAPCPQPLPSSGCQCELPALNLAFFESKITISDEYTNHVDTLQYIICLLQMQSPYFHTLIIRPSSYFSSSLVFYTSLSEKFVFFLKEMHEICG